FAMLNAMARSLNHVGHDLLLSYDNRIGPQFLPSAKQAEPVHDESSWNNAIETLSDSADLGLIIAPEDDGVLVDVLQRTRKRGLEVVSPDTETVAYCSDKINCAGLFEELSLPVPKMIFGTINDLLNDYQELKFPVVLKPAISSGATCMFVANDVGSLLQIAHRPEVEGKLASFILQEYVDGVHSSVSLLTNNGKSHVLSVNRQNISVGASEANPGYHGGESPFDHPAAKKATTYARKIVSSLSNLMGYIGIDFVLKGEEAYPMEINPRLTVSALGLERTMGPKGLSSIIECASGLPKKPPVARGYSLFEEYIDIRQGPKPYSHVDDYARVMIIPGVSSPPIPLPDGTTLIRPYICGWGESRSAARDNLGSIKRSVDERLEGIAS
ncbi:MAG: ATP-grasp domain-containing protein, partial [Candidatus Thorarchaeota archaeon]